MKRPEVRIIQQQEEISSNPIEGWEAEQILRKYGYETQQHSSNTSPEGLTFEEMVAMEESRLREERMRLGSTSNQPKPITFDGREGYHSETRYGSDDDTGYGFKINIVSDMPIPRH